MSLRSIVGGLAFVALACSSTADPPPNSMSNITGSDGSVVLGSTPFPCEVGAALQSKCWSCHGDKTNYGAPMHLTSWEAVHQKTKDGTEELFQRMQERIHDSAAPMPPKLNPALTPAEMQTLDSWLAQGAPAGTGCAPPPPPPGGGGTTSTSGAGGATSTSTGGVYYGSTGGISNTGTGGVYVGPDPTPDSGSGGPQWSPEDVPKEPTEAECDYLHFVARQDASNAKYNVPSGEQYYCFGYHVQAETGAQALAFYPEIDNTSVIHHWLLYKTTTPQTNGQFSACIGAHGDGELIAGWAPGAGPWFLPEHVGLEIGTGDFILEVHYNNTGGPAQDQSGVKMCKAKQQRPDMAGISWLGTEWISIPPGAQNFPVANTCRPNSTEQIHILKTWPHMHKLGRHMTARIHRNDGSVEPLVDVDFDFNYQWQYDTPAILEPGEWIDNTCFFTNDTGATVGFGESTSSEMCYDFVVAYPPRKLVSIGLMTTSCNNP